MTDAMRMPWRVGRKVGRTIYNADDVLIGMMDTIDQAIVVVESVNAEGLRRSILSVEGSMDDATADQLKQRWLARDGCDFHSMDRQHHVGPFVTYANLTGPDSCRTCLRQVNPL